MAAHGSGVLVFPEASGLGAHAVARACDLHGDGRLVDGLDEAMGLLKPLFADPSRTRVRARGGLDALLARPEVDRSRDCRDRLPLRRHHGAGTGTQRCGTAAPQTDAKAIRARVLVCIGADDPITPGQRAGFEAEMREAGMDWQMHLYGNTVHGLTNQETGERDRPDALRYGPDAGARSWASMRALPDETLA